MGGKSCAVVTFPVGPSPPPGTNQKHGKPLLNWSCGMLAAIVRLTLRGPIIELARGECGIPATPAAESAVKALYRLASPQRFGY